MSKHTVPSMNYLLKWNPIHYHSILDSFVDKILCWEVLIIYFGMTQSRQIESIKRKLKLVVNYAVPLTSKANAIRGLETYWD